MPIPNVTVTGDEFTWLQQNVSDQADVMQTVSAIAYSGLQYVVLLQVVTPEVDLVTPSHSQYQSSSSFNSDSNFTSWVTSLNMHVIDRGTTLLATDTTSTRLNRWLSGEGVQVTQTYARISSGAGFYIDSANIL
jgi:hypothetical protein